MAVGLSTEWPSYDNKIAVRKKSMLQNQTTARPLLAKLCSS